MIPNPHSPICLMLRVTASNTLPDQLCHRSRRTPTGLPINRHLPTRSRMTGILQPQRNRFCLQRASKVNLVKPVPHRGTRIGASNSFKERLLGLDALQQVKPHLKVFESFRRCLRHPCPTCSQTGFWDHNRCTIRDLIQRPVDSPLVGSKFRISEEGVIPHRGRFLRRNTNSVRLAPDDRLPAPPSSLKVVTEQIELLRIRTKCRNIHMGYTLNNMAWSR